MKYLSKIPWLKLSLLLFSLLMLQPEEAEASHFRYGSITWERVSGQPYQIRFRIAQAWRRSFYGSPNVGANINGGSFNTGNGSVTINLTVTSVNVAEDWLYGEFTYVKTYPSVNTNYTASFGSCCRIGSPLINNNNGSFLVSSIVQVGNNNDAPVSTVPPFISLPVNMTAATYQIPATDPNNDALTYSLVPNGQFGSGTTQPTGISISSSGLLTFNTVGKSVGQFYSVAVYVTDSKGARIQLDLMIRISAPSTPPVYDYTVTPANNTNYVLQPGQSVSFNVKASDVDAGDNVTLSAVGVPVGASFTPGSGNPVTRSFSWTPTLANIGTFQVNFVAQDNAGIQTNTIVNISVSLKPNFVSPSPQSGSIFCYTPGSTITNTFKAEDVDTADRVILSLATTAQSGMSFSPSLPTSAANPVSSNFTWNTTSANWGINTVVIRATDTYNDTRDDSIFYIINNPPVFATTQGNATITAGQPFSYTFSGTDANIAQGDAISLSHTHYPSWMSIVNNGNGTWTISGTPTLADSGTHHVSLQLEDMTNHFRGTHCGDATQTFEVTVLPCNITTGTSVTNMSAAGVNDGAIDLTVNNATSPVTYVWSNSANTQDISGLPAGTYTVNITDNNGCTATASGTVYEPATALNFDGGNDKIVVPHSSSLNVSAGGELTMEAWVYPTVSGTWRNIAMKGSYGYGMILSPANQIAFWDQGSGVSTPKSTSTVPANQWSHIAVTVKDLGSSLEVRFYLNGAPAGVSTSSQSTINDNTGSLIIGEQGTGCICNRFVGNMDELRIWSRALCQGEIMNNMNCELNPAGQSGLAALYHFNQGYINANNSTVTTAVDASGNGNNGTLSAFSLNGGISNWVAGTVSGTCGTFIPPTASITAAGATTFCSGSSVVLNANTGNGYSYQWYLNGSPITNATNASYTASAAGNYTVDVTVNGCTATATPTNVTVNSVPVPSVVATNMSAPGVNDGAVDLTITNATPPITYAWSNSAATEDISGLSAGTYTVNITDNNGCTATASGTVYEPATAIHMDGVNDYIDIGNLLGANSSYTKEAWVYLDNYNNHANNIISSQRSPLWINVGAGYKLSVSNEFNTVNATTITDANVFPTGQWVHVAATYDATTAELKLYKNGVLVASTANAAGYQSQNISIGQNPNGNNFEGKIDEARLWDRALCQGEILNNMNCELNPAGQSGLVALYHLNQGYINANNTGVTNVTDASGNGNDGTLINSSLNGANSNWTAGTVSGTCGTFIPPTASITASGSTTICDGTTVTLTANTGNGYSYQWYLNGNAINGATNASYDAGAAGNYTVDVTVLGCTATSSATAVIVNPLTVFTACPTNISANTAQGQCSETVNYTATATGASTPSYSYVFTGATTGNGNGTGSGATFNTGVTNVVITASDICGTVTCSFTVTVVDNQNPTITCPADVTVNADNGACAATNVSLGNPATADNCGVQGTSNNALSSYPVGTTVVTWTVTDINGNTATCTQNVTVVDNQNPTIACPADVTVNADNGACAATNVNLGAPTTADNCGVQGTSNDGLSSYPVGTTVVTWTVTDIHGNTATCTQNVTVVDNQNPTIACPADVTVNADNGACAATNVSLGTPATADNCGVQGTSNNGLSSYPVGTTVVTWTVTDIHGNTATCNQNVTVVDNQNPAAVCQPFTLSLTGGTGTVLPSDVDGGSSDNCGIAGMSVSPNTFTCANAGENTVVLTVTDVNGNSASCTTTVTVQYQPTCTITTTPSNNTYTGGNPNNIYLGYGPQSATITANTTGGSGFTYSWSPAANLSCTNCQSPVFTPTSAGNYTYTVTVTNSNGCSTTCTVSFCVIDARAKDNKGKYNGKVYLCHVPPGNNNNPQTLSISVNAVPSHLGNHSGDRLGTCDMSCNSSAKGGRNNGETGAEEDREHSIEELVAEKGIRVYPNPNNGMFTLNLPTTEETQIFISNVSGQVVYRNTVSGTQKVSIDLSGKAQGIYMIQVVTGTDTYHAKVNIQQ